MMRLFAILTLACGLASPALAQNTLENARAISLLCRFGQQTDAVGCSLLKNTLGLPPVSLVRFMGAQLYRARNEARNPDDEREAQTLFTQWLDALAIGRQVRESMFRNDAGVLIESAWITRLQACNQGARRPCNMLQGNEVLLFQRTKALLNRVYPEHRRILQMLENVPIGAPA
jgi:hypothetical protein